MTKSPSGGGAYTGDGGVRERSQTAKAFRGTTTGQGGCDGDGMPADKKIVVRMRGVTETGSNERKQPEGEPVI